jgi:superfamily I DNA and/or RNA helicase
MHERGATATLCKVGDHDEDELVEQGVIHEVKNDDVPGVLDAGRCLVGGTTWLFSRDELVGRFDYLFIDEAGQFSLANAVAAGQAARNLILVGDQMQLAQVTKGTQDRGIFLEQSRRMHPDVCRFVSDAVYEGRLGTIPSTARHRVLRSSSTALVPAETGIAWVPVEHDGCEQKSDEECDKIVAIVEELLGRRVVDSDGDERDMRIDDILIVAPFNLQVRCLRERLPGIRIGSVDKFQGQEAPVVIVSLCSSTLEEAPRGASFLLNPNRLNVAVSRAEALAIVVGCPELMDIRCHSVEEMKLVNLLCHLVQYAEEQTAR